FRLGWFQALAKPYLIKFIQLASKNSLLKFFFRKMLPFKSQRWLYLNMKNSLRTIDTISISDANNPEWDKFAYLSRKIKEIDQLRIENLTPKPTKILTVEPPGILEKFSASVKFKLENDPIVSIIIPVHNNTKLTLECLR